MIETNFIQQISIWAIPLIFAITLHEVAHGYVASFFGDKTARLMGRLSLNPIKHIDLVGTIIVPLLMLFLTNFIFGWAKPVPVDPRNLHHPRRDMAFVALAGPFANIAMAFFWGMIAKIGFLVAASGNEWVGLPLKFMGIAGINVNVVLAILNLIPLPPLDGSKILMSLLPPRAAYQFSLIEPYSFVILILLLVTGILGSVMSPFLVALIYAIETVFRL